MTGRSKAGCSRRWAGQWIMGLLVAGLVMAGCPIMENPGPDPNPNPNPNPGPGPGPDPVPVNPVSTSPGIQVDFLRVEIPNDLRPVARFTVTDDAGQTIPLRELGDARFILAYLEPDPGVGSTARFVSYNTRTEATPSGGTVPQATYDGGGLAQVVQEDDGSFSYKFATALPADYTAHATHQVGGQFTRLFPIDGLTYIANPTYAFRPDGAMELASRAIVTTESCNVCHTRLQAHGVRREVQLCILCHNAGSIDGNTGNSVDFAEMVHKIHRGISLPSVQDGELYQLIGFRGAVHDYSEVQFPQPVQNCTACHKDDAPMADVFLTKPTIAGCASCHDRTWFGDPLAIPANFERHIGGQQVNDNLCALCHTPAAPGPSPIFEAHRLPTDSPLAPGLSLTVNAVTTVLTETGASVTINFTAADKAGVPYTDLTRLAAVAATVGYPVSDYERARRETINANNAVYNGDGTFSYTFANEIPADTGDTFAVAMDGRLTFALNDANITQGTSSHGRLIFTVDGTPPVERRKIVDDAKCNACHDEVRFHGNLRVGVDSCVMCHNPSGTDINRRPADQGFPESINFKDMIHQIHRGSDLATEFTIFGFGSIPHDYTGINFPGDLRNCEMCHVPGSYGLPLSGDALSTVIADAEGTILAEKLPERASCTSCHDSLIAEVHAILNTDRNARVESCAVCHGNSADFSVLDVHNMGP